MSLSPHKYALKQAAQAKPMVHPGFNHGRKDERNPLFNLQRVVGNHAIQRLIKAGPKNNLQESNFEKPAPSPFSMLAGKTVNEPTCKNSALDSQFPEQQYSAQPCQSRPAGGGAALNGPAAAFGNTFNILWSNASVNGRFRPPITLDPNTIRQNGPSFSMGGRVEAPPTAAGFRLGVIQQIVQSERQCQYSTLSGSAPAGIKEWSRGPGLDLAPGSATPWYDSSRVRIMARTAITGISDDPSGDFHLVVDSHGNTRGTPDRKLARYSGCSQFRTWLVIESPAQQHRAIAWAEWAANFDIAYNTAFTSLQAGPPTVSAACSALTGWMTSTLQIGSGLPIPTNVAPPHQVNWRP